MLLDLTSDAPDLTSGAASPGPCCCPRSWNACPCCVRFSVCGCPACWRRSSSCDFLVKDHRAAVMANSHDAVLWDKRHTQEGQELHVQSWDLHTFWGVGSGHSAVVADPGQAAAAGQEGDPMRPTSILWHQLTERHFATPGRTGWLLIYFFTVGRKHSSFEVTGSHCQQDVGMPIQAEGHGVDGLFNVLAHPSVIFRLKVPNRDESCPAAYGKSVLTWLKWLHG